MATQSTSVFTPDINEQLLILSSSKELRCEYLNHSARDFCNISKNSSEEFCFFQKFMHPEDYEDFLAQIGQLKKDGRLSTTARLKDGNGNYYKFLIESREYAGNSTAPHILSTATKILHPEEEATVEQLSGFNLSKREYEDLLNSLDEGFCIVELIYNANGTPIDYLYLNSNPAFKKHVDFDQVAGKTVSELVKTPNKDWLKIFGEVAKNGKAVRLQDTNENLGGIWLDLYAFKIGSPESRRIGILFRNITHRKQVEAQMIEELKANHKDLQESKVLLQNVFDNTNLGIAVLKTVLSEDKSIKDFVFLRVNKVLRELYLQEDIIGKNYTEVSKHGTKIGIFDAYKEVIRTGVPYDQEFYYDKGETPMWFRVTARAREDLLITSIEDVTQRKAAAEELKESLRFKRELVRTTPEVILIINLDEQRVRYINKDILPESGITKEKVQGMKLDQILPFVHPRDREKIIELHKNLLKSSLDDILDIEVRLKLQGIKWEWFSVRGKIFKKKDTKWVEEYVLLIRNITDKKATQKALLKAEKLSIQGEMARTFAHELRNPLASIGMVNKVLHAKIDPVQREEFKTYFNILTRSTKTLNNLVSNLLNASNYSPAVLEKTDLAAVVDKTLHKASDRIYLAGIKVTKKYKGPYPILADSDKLEIAILNILVNASEATAPGEGKITVEITETDSEFVLSITDNGHGMDQEQLDHLFEAFYSNKATGMGVGMNSVKNILEEHDAPIKVVSKPNDGAVFRIFFHNADKL
jgi:PAS domain S-box-containing protein